MKKDTMLADYLMLPWSALVKGSMWLVTTAVKLSLLVIPVALVVGAVLAVNRLLNHHSEP
jgi:hypothetical protein